MSDKPPHDCRLQKRNARDSEEPPSPGRLIYFPYPVDCCIAYRHALIFPKYQPLSQREIILSADGAHGAWAQYCTSRMPPVCSAACRHASVCFQQQAPSTPPAGANPTAGDTPPRGPPPPVRRASLQAARRVGAPRPEAQPARARPQAGARCCAAPEGQGGRRRLVMTA